MTTSTDHAKEQAQAQLDHIRELMEWLDHANECDELDGEGECFWANTITEDILGRPTEPTEVHDPDKATQAIHENALSVEVRSGWRTLNSPEGETASEFRILLCTGGPAVRIIGELNEYGEPESARLEYQDWSTPWTEYYQYVDETNDVLRYVQQFYFGA